MAYKFEKLEVWQKALDYADLVYDIADEGPSHEKYGLASQITRAANSIALNIAEGSTSQSDKEQARFLGLAIRSLVETVACLHLIERREYLDEVEPLREAYRFSEPLFAQLQAFRSFLKNPEAQANEPSATYDADSDVPF